MGMRSTHGEEGGEKCLVRPKEQRKWQEEHMEGTGGSLGCADILPPGRVLPFPFLCSLGLPPARAGGQQQEMGGDGTTGTSPAQLGGVSHEAAPCVCPGWLLL